MGFRFRKSLSPFKGLRINLGKKGLSASVGVKGARIGVGSKGAYTSMSIPKTGISSVNYIEKGKKQAPSAPEQKRQESPLLGFLFVVAVIITIFQHFLGFLLIVGVFTIAYFQAKRKAEEAKNPKE